MFDLLIKGANLQDGRSGIDIACSAGRIVAVEPRIVAEAAEVIDATGRLVTPPFVDAHWHLDAALLQPGAGGNESGALYDGIDAWKRIKDTQTVDDYKRRARQALTWSVARGTQFVRCQTDICDPQLRQVQALIELREELKPWIELQIVAFPQDGYFRDPNAADLMARALDMGVDVVGGIPDYELTAAEGHESIKVLCEMAKKRGLLVDMHIDQTPDPASRQIEALTQQAIRLGTGARISASHCVSMFHFHDYYASKLIAQMAQAGLSVCVQPLTAATCWGAMTRMSQLLDAGINVALGQDCVLDPWYSLGNCDMLDAAHMAIVFGRMLEEKKKAMVFDCATYGGARALQLADYGIAPGRHADLVILQAATPNEAIRLRPPRLAVIRRGQVICRQAPQQADLAWNSLALSTDFSIASALASPGIHGRARP